MKTILARERDDLCLASWFTTSLNAQATTPLVVKKLFKSAESLSARHVFFFFALFEALNSSALAIWTKLLFYWATLWRKDKLERSGKIVKKSCKISFLYQVRHILIAHSVLKIAFELAKIAIFSHFREDFSLDEINLSFLARETFLRV